MDEGERPVLRRQRRGGFVIFSGDEPQMNHELTPRPFSTPSGPGHRARDPRGWRVRVNPSTRSANILRVLLPSLKSARGLCRAFPATRWLGVGITSSTSQFSGHQAGGSTPWCPRTISPTKGCRYSLSSSARTIGPGTADAAAEPHGRAERRSHRTGRGGRDPCPRGTRSSSSPQSMPELQVEAYLERVRAEFRERPFLPSATCGSRVSRACRRGAGTSLGRPTSVSPWR